MVTAARSVPSCRRGAIRSSSADSILVSSSLVHTLIGGGSLLRCVGVGAALPPRPVDAGGRPEETSGRSQGQAVLGCPGLRAALMGPGVELAVRPEVVAVLAVRRFPQVRGLVGIPAPVGLLGSVSRAGQVAVQ